LTYSLVSDKINRFALEVHMPIVELRGPWSKLPLSDSHALNRELKECVAEIAELEISPGQVSCQFITPYIQDEREITVIVWGLFKRPKRTEAVRRRLAERVRDQVAKHFPDHFIEVFVNPFDPKQGFAATHHPH